MRLFVERAGAVSPGFELDESNAGAVARICHRLDGLPLALELAAARIDALAAGALAERLDDRFRLLRAGSRTAPTRQQTLEAALDWSYELLADVERVLLRRLAVFSGGFTLEAAEEVCAGDGLERAQVADVLARLVEKSLVTTEERQGARRYRQLETIRAYATARLAEAEERAALSLRQAEWLAGLVERGDSQLSGLDPEARQPPGRARDAARRGSTGRARSLRARLAVLVAADRALGGAALARRGARARAGALAGARGALLGSGRGRIPGRVR